MDVKEFREKVRPFMKLSIDDKEFIIEEIVKFRFDDGTFYIKCWLNNGYVFADDINENMYVLVKKIETLFCQPFDRELEFDTKKFKFLYSAHAIAEEIYGKEVFKKGGSEEFWDYKADDNSYLSLGINDQTKQREDFYGAIINVSSVQLHETKL